MDLKQQILHLYRVDELSLWEIARRLEGGSAPDAAGLEPAAGEDPANGPGRCRHLGFLRNFLT